ncbi:MAG: kinE 1, partial [Sediminibacterium sp.]|nr:kinE 1 [Sediminibacterium sp.]
MTDSKENAYRALFEQASDCILVTDFSGNLIDANAAVVSTFGYSKEELMKMHISALIEAEDLRANPIRFQLLDQGAQIFNERPMVLKNGTIIEVEVNVKKFNPTSIMAIVRDVTERNKVRAHLQRTYERLNYHLSNTPLAVIEEDKDLVITYWNRQAEEIFGWRAEEVIGKRIIDFMV